MLAQRLLARQSLVPAQRKLRGQRHRRRARHGQGRSQPDQHEDKPRHRPQQERLRQRPPDRPHGRQDVDELEEVRLGPDQ